FGKEKSVYPILNELGRAARSKSNDGATARLSLCGDYTKVFTCGNHHCFCPLVQMPQLVIGDLPPDLDITGSLFTKFVQLRTTTGNHKSPVKSLESLNDEIKSFIRHQCTDSQVKIVASRVAGRLEEQGVRWRVNDCRLPAVVGLYPFTDEL